MVYHNSKFVTVSAGLLFLLATAEMAPALPLDGGSHSYAVTEASPSLAGEWINKTDTPFKAGRGEAVVGTDDYIYVARCWDNRSTSLFYRYNPDNDPWTKIEGLQKGAFKTGTALTWDNGSYIYALLGARYDHEDDNRCLFYRYSILNNSWENLTDTLTEDVLYGQGAGDAITWANDYVYAIIGNKDRESIFARYNCSEKSWGLLSLPRNWKNKTDDGASLVWTGGEYLYALQGEIDEGNGSKNNNFSRYDIVNNRWDDMADIPEGSCGVGDGGSLLWIGNWVEEYANYIFALGGGCARDTDGDGREEPGYNFYAYIISNTTWEPLTPIHYPVGEFVGNRFGFARGHIYYWQGNKNYTKHSEYGNGTAFCMFNIFPVASFTYSPELPYVDQKIIFNASSSYDPGGFIKEYKWDFGDGTNINGKIVNHSYSKPGDYIVTLTVVDDNNAANTTNKTIDPLSIFDTGQPQNPYPSISGTHNGTIKPNQTITVSKLYTYPCVRTGGHTEYARIWNSTLDEITRWDGYKGDWHNISFNEPFTLLPNETYNYTIKTGSYPQIHHTPALPTANGWINCTEFRDANGKIYYDWIPAIKLYF